MTLLIDSQLLVLGGQEVEQEAVVRLAVDPVAVPLPTDELEVRALPDFERNVVLHGPAADRFEAQLTEAERDQLAVRPGRVALAGVGLLAQHDPDAGGLELAVDVTQAGDADRRHVVVRREHAQQVRVQLRHDLDQRGRRRLPGASEVQPLPVLLPGQPAGGQREQSRTVQGQKLHAAPCARSRGCRRAMNSAIRAVVRKCSTSMSSTDTVRSNVSSRCAKSSTNRSESSSPVSTRSVSGDGTSIWSFSVNSAAIRGSRVAATALRSGWSKGSSFIASPFFSDASTVDLAVGVARKLLVCLPARRQHIRGEQLGEVSPQAQRGHRRARSRYIGAADGRRLETVRGQGDRGGLPDVRQGEQGSLDLAQLDAVSP